MAYTPSNEKNLVSRISAHVSVMERNKVDVFLKRIKNRLLKTPRTEKVSIKKALLDVF